MASSKKRTAAENAVAGGGDSSMFDITLDQLTKLMEERGNTLMEKLNSSDYNGVNGLLEKLKVDGRKGLDSNNEQDLEQRRTAYGKNIIPNSPPPSLLELGSYVLQSPLTALSDWRREREFHEARSEVDKDQQVSVIRDSHTIQIPVSELVVGDLCFIKYGDLLSADGIIIQASDLKIDESSITGETDLVKKSVKEDAGLLSGTQVMEGSGRMLVVAVGLNSQTGQVVELLRSS